MDSAEHLTAVSANNYLGKAMGAAEAALVSILAGMNAATSDQLFLHLHENLAWDDSLMAVFHIVLRNEAVVFDSLFREEINGIGFLQKGVADVLLVAKNRVNVTCMPFFLSGSIQDAICLQTMGNLHHTGAFKVFPVDALHGFGFFRYNHQLLVLIFGIAEEPFTVDLDFALLVAVLKTQLHILAEGLAFLLGEGCHNRKHDLALRIHAINVFLLEIYRDV